MGLVGNAPELKVLDTGPLCHIRVAVYERHRSVLTGEYKELTTWFSCTAFSQNAEYAVKKLKPGTPVYIEGRIRERKNPKDGLTYWNVNVDILRNLTMRVKKKPEGDGVTPQPVKQAVDEVAHLEPESTPP